jgi:mannan endo-1,4-beta-mannosidase
VDIYSAQGLDYIVAAACTRNIRLVMTLTNYLSAYGGMQTWVQWFNGSNISEFFSNTTIRSYPS